MWWNAGHWWLLNDTYSVGFCFSLDPLSGWVGPSRTSPVGVWSIWLISWVGNPFTYCWESQFRCSLWEVHRPSGPWHMKTQAKAPKQAWMACCQLQPRTRVQVPGWSMIVVPQEYPPHNETSRRADSSPRWASANRTGLNSKMLRWDGSSDVSWLAGGFKHPSRMMFIIDCVYYYYYFYICLLAT